MKTLVYRNIIHVAAQFLFCINFYARQTLTHTNEHWTLWLKNSPWKMTLVLSHSYSEFWRFIFSISISNKILNSHKNCNQKWRFWWNQANSKKNIKWAKSLNFDVFSNILLLLVRFHFKSINLNFERKHFSENVMFSLRQY